MAAVANPGCMRMLEAVLPISNREPARRNLDRAGLLLKSLEFFWTGPGPFVIHVVVPDAELSAIANALLNFGLNGSLKIHLMSESEVSPLIGTAAGNVGYAKQMLIKLSAYKIVHAPFCIIFDTDILCCRPFGQGTFLTGEKAASDWVAPTLWEWWFESAKILKINLSNDELKRPRLGVTPQILSTDILELLAARLTNLFGGNWIQGLIERYSGDHPNIWTEYTLYDLFATEARILDRFHLLPDEIDAQRMLQCRKYNVWSPEDYKNWNPTDALSDDSVGHFMVMQSIIARDVDFDDVKNRWVYALKARYPVG